MNTKHAREIRKGIRFAYQIYAAIQVTEHTKLQHFWLIWVERWSTEASTRSLRAYVRTLERLEYKDFLNQIQPVYPKDHP